MTSRVVDSRFTFGLWKPDMTTITTEVDLSVARNCYFRGGAYRPCNSLAPALNPNDAAHTGVLLHMDSYIDSNGDSQNYGICNDGHIVTIRNGILTSVHDASAVLGDALNVNQCDIKRYGDRLAICAVGSRIQTYDPVADTLTDNADSPMGATSLHVFKEFLMASVEADLYWSDTNDITTWSGSTNPGLAGDVRLVRGGVIRAINGVEHVLVFMQRSIARMTLTGTASVFTLHYLTDAVGTITTNRGVVARSKRYFFISEHGIHVINDFGELRDIGAMTINVWLRNNEMGRLTKGIEVSAAVNINEEVIYWHLSDGREDNVLLYSINDDAFSTATYQDIKSLHNYSGESENLDTASGEIPSNRQLDGDDLNLDDPALSNQTYSMLAQNNDDLIQYFSNNVIQINLVSKIVPFSILIGEPVYGESRAITRIRSGERVKVKHVQPVKNGGNVSCAMDTDDVYRNNLDCLFDEYVNEDRDGRCYFINKSGVYFCLSLTISGDWKEVVGGLIEMEHAGRARTPASSGENEIMV